MQEPASLACSKAQKHHPTIVTVGMEAKLPKTYRLRTLHVRDVRYYIIMIKVGGTTQAKTQSQDYAKRVDGWVGEYKRALYARMYNVN